MCLFSFDILSFQLFFHILNNSTRDLKRQISSGQRLTGDISSTYTSARIRTAARIQSMKTQLETSQMRKAGVGEEKK